MVQKSLKSATYWHGTNIIGLPFDAIVIRWHAGMQRHFWNRFSFIMPKMRNRRKRNPIWCFKKKSDPHYYFPHVDSMHVQEVNQNSQNTLAAQGLLRRSFYAQTILFHVWYQIILWHTSRLTYCKIFDIIICNVQNSLQIAEIVFLS